MTFHTILGNASLKPSLLKTHQERSHPGPRETLPSHKIKRARPSMGIVPVRCPLLHASYEVALQCEHNEVPHTIAEKLVKLCAMKWLNWFWERMLP